MPGSQTGGSSTIMFLNGQHRPVVAAPSGLSMAVPVETSAPEQPRCSEQAELPTLFHVFLTQFQESRCCFPCVLGAQDRVFTDIFLPTVTLWSFCSHPKTCTFPTLGASRAVGMAASSRHQRSLHLTTGGDTEQDCGSLLRAEHRVVRQ